MSFEPPVGVIGIGLMGEVFARRLVAAGFGVVGFDIDPEKTARLSSFGARAAASIADLTRAAQPIVLAVFNTDQVEEVTEREILPALEKPGKIILCTSTCDPDRVASLGERMTQHGLKFLETPVSGTSEQVRQGDGVGLIGGAATRLGLDPEAFLKVAQGSAAYSQVMETKGRKMIAGDFRPEGRARQTLKDVHLMLDQARKAGQPLPLLEVHADVLEACLRQGAGELDNSVIVEEIRRRGAKAAKPAAQ